MLMEPPLPLATVPVPTRSSPLLPELVVPLLNIRKPLTPVVPALAVLITMDPLVVLVPCPVNNDKKPPVSTSLRPVFTNMCPPAAAAAVVVEAPDRSVNPPPATLVPVPTVMLMEPPLPLAAVPV